MSPFRDLHPHAGPRPDLRVDQLTEGGTGEPADRAIYRAIYRAMPVAGLPDELQVGTVSVFQTMGPVLSQFTEVRQRPGLKLLFDKEMRTAVPVGASQWLTVGQLEVDADSDASREFPRWRDTVSEAIGLLAAVLDERVALEVLSEDLVYLSGGKPVQSADMRQGLREVVRIVVELRRRIPQVG